MGKFIPLSLLLLTWLGAPAAAITLGQVDDFEDGTTESWATGAPMTVGPFNQLDGGPEGAGDAYLQLESNGGDASGSKLVSFNNSQWSGDYTSAGVTGIEVALDNLGATDLEIRLGISGDGGIFATTDSVPLPAGGGWQTARFAIGPNAWAILGSTDIDTTLATANSLRILHAPEPAFSGPAIVATLGVDDLRAVPEPGSGVLLATGLLALGLCRPGPSRAGCRARSARGWRQCARTG